MCFNAKHLLFLVTEFSKYHFLQAAFLDFSSLRDLALISEGI